MSLDQSRQNAVTQFLPDFGVAEERRDADQHLLEQKIQLLRVVTQEICIGSHGVDAVHRHAARDAPQLRVRFVGSEVVAGAVLQELENRIQCDCRIGIGIEGGQIGYGLTTCHAQDAFRHVGGERDNVDTGRGNGAPGHGIEQRRIGLLREGQAALR